MSSYSQEIAWQILMAAIKRMNQEGFDENQQTRHTEDPGEVETNSQTFAQVYNG